LRGFGDVTTLHPQTHAAWARTILFGRAAVLRAISASYFREGMDPDTYVRRYGVAALELLGIRVDVRPYDHKARAAAKYERTWNAIEAAYARREGTALWWEEWIAEVARQRRAEAERARQEAALAELRARLAVRGRGASAEQRASAWLSYRDANSSYAAWQAVLGVVRGFALGPQDGRVMIQVEYEPRFYRKFAAGELDGWVKRAMRANKPWGWLLTEERRTG
jgi:hypothetical protein